VELVPGGFRLRKRALQAWMHGERELRLLALLCDRHALSLDVGASVGIYSYFLRRHSAGVVAFEPVPEYAAFIRAALPEVRVYESAVSDHSGPATLRIPVDADGTSSPTLEPSDALTGRCSRDLVVDLATIDSFDLSRVGFMKIDVEGHELSVLNGALTTLVRDRPTILVEAEERHREGAVNSVRMLLGMHGYRGYFLYRDHIEPIERFDLRLHQDPALLGDNPSGSAEALYASNFIFVHTQNERLAERLLRWHVPNRIAGRLMRTRRYAATLRLRGDQG
jgi:FkbM family methyltransferase